MVFFLGEFLHYGKKIWLMQQPYRKLGLQKLNLLPYIDDTKRSHWVVLICHQLPQNILGIDCHITPCGFWSFACPPPTRTMPSPSIMQAQIKPLLPNVQAQKLLSFSIMHNSKFTLLPAMNNGIWWKDH